MEGSFNQDGLVSSAAGHLRGERADEDGMYDDEEEDRVQRERMSRRKIR